ncbi:hypothetical protein [Verrucomicrobium sp. BvORR106]|uniref:hypothetical protein n=1 Tax=Verrucomicrobium sp. BvORR106 TaxID=1403819 RepID=UPI0005718878|nr:hypothetical protein [Verrucomicrobium sp. BvORR106]
MNHNIKKFIIIGSSSLAGISGRNLTCIRWDKLTPKINLRDFDVVIISTLAFGTSDQPNVDWATFFHILNPTIARDVSAHGGVFMIVGNPTFDVHLDKGKASAPFLSWTGLQLEWDIAHGDTMQFLDSRVNTNFATYCSYIAGWQYSLRSCSIGSTGYDAIEDVARSGGSIILHRDDIATNRHKNALATRIKVKHKVTGHQYSSTETTILHYILLPPINFSNDDTLLLVLRDVCNLPLAVNEPEWVKEWIAPNQIRIDAQIASLGIAMRKLQSELDAAQSDRNKSRQCLKLLYSRDHELEEIVRSVLRSLGAIIEDPTGDNKEDGWISVNAHNSILEGVLEIKSTEKDSFTEQGLRQLGEWKTRGIVERHKKFKGIFVGNSALMCSPDSRPYPFSDSFLKAATLSEVCILMTSDLYAVYQLHCEGALDYGAFWTALFSTNGLFSWKSDKGQSKSN